MDAPAKPRDELAIERDWLRGLVRDLGTLDFSRPELSSASAQALVEYALGGERPSQEQYPKDANDLRGCLNVLEQAPAHLKDKMEEVVAAFEQASSFAPAAKQEGVFGVPVSEFIRRLEQGQYVAEVEDLPPVTADYSDDELLAEWQWLRARASLMAKPFARDEQVPRSWGRSSNALVDYALGGPRPGPSSYPLDLADLAACQEAMLQAPPHLKAKMEPVFDDYRRAVELESSSAGDLGL